MKFFLAIFGFISFSNLSFGQLNETLWTHYLSEKQLADNKVKLVIVERGDFLKHQIRPDGKIQKTTMSNSDKSYYGEDNFYYYGDTLIEIRGYRRENIYNNNNYKYNGGFIELCEVYINKYLSKKYIYGTNSNGWINFISENKVISLFKEEELWRKSIKYYEDGVIKSIDYRRGSRYQNSYYVYNKQTDFIEKEKITGYNNSQETDNREINISTYETGLTKSITIDGHTEYLSYEFYKPDEYKSAIDTLILIRNKIKLFEKLKSDLINKTNKEYQYILKDIESIYLDCKQHVNEKSENIDKLKILADATEELIRFNNLEVKELKKLNREIKKQYGL
jgi:hypothetical protein